LQGWQNFKEEMKQDTFTYLVRGKEIKVETKYESLSHLKIPKIALPKFQDWGDLFVGKVRKTFQERFLTLREFILSKER
jgi:methylmalonyl-CoA mutase